MGKRTIHGWGRYPIVEAEVHDVEPGSSQDHAEGTNTVIPFAAGRSYGDSALNEVVLATRRLDRFIGFAEETGVLHLNAGVTLKDVLDVFVPRGWFLSVVPGTKFVTVGGAIASDIHGKNHHKDGCFSAFVQEIELQLPAGDVVVLNPQDKLFRATCGGMGLTGLIVSAKIQLKRIPSTIIQQTTYKTADLDETFRVFEQSADEPYSVAWIDCLAQGKQLGRSLVSTGDFSTQHGLELKKSRSITYPFKTPGWLLNSKTVGAFNALYYGRYRKDRTEEQVYFDKFFFPLDSILHWNRMYGRRGFVQYQFILPLSESREGMRKALELIARSGEASFLAVLKLYGKENQNYLSFPMQGYSLALDFKVSEKVLSLLDQLDEIVLQHAGRVYLAKDARLNKHAFDAGYPNADQFRKLRKELNLTGFSSLQSRRLDL